MKGRPKAIILMTPAPKETTQGGRKRIKHTNAQYEKYPVGEKR